VTVSYDEAGGTHNYALRLRDENGAVVGSDIESTATLDVVE